MYEPDIQYINKDIHQSLSSVHKISSKSQFVVAEVNKNDASHM